MEASDTLGKQIAVQKNIKLNLIHCILVHFVIELYAGNTNFSNRLNRGAIIGDQTSKFALVVQ